VPAAHLTATLRAGAADGSPSGQRGLWVSFLSAYGLEAVLGARPPEGDASGAGAIAWVGLDLQHGDLGLDDVVPLLRVAERAGVAVLPRLASHAGAAIGKVVDAGVQGVIVPGVESAVGARGPHARRSA
jgi:4-hydroxy-2-oxoheptanedioate aldolase